MRILNSMPVFGFETSGCHYSRAKNKTKNQHQYNSFNTLKVTGCIPVLGGIPFGIVLIYLGVTALRSDSSKQLGKCDYPNLKGVAFITRGVITLAGGGVLFALADVATTVGRAAKARLFSNQ